MAPSTRNRTHSAQVVNSFNPFHSTKDLRLLTLPHDFEAGDKVTVKWTDGQIFGITFPTYTKKGSNVLVVAPDKCLPTSNSSSPNQAIGVRKKEISSSSNLKRKRSRRKLSQKKKKSIFEDAFQSIVWPFMLQKGWRKANEKDDEKRPIHTQNRKYVFTPPDSYRIRVTTTKNSGAPQSGIVKGIKNAIEFIKLSSDYDDMLKKFHSALDRNTDQAQKDHVKEYRATRSHAKLCKWKYCGKLYPKKSSLIGDKFQVSYLPPMDSGQILAANGYDTIWDPSSADMSTCMHTNKEGFRVFKDPFNIKNKNKEDEWTEEDIAKYKHSIVKSNKDFSFISKIVGKSRGECLHFYYTRFKMLPEYSKLKKKIKESSKKVKQTDVNADFCFICLKMGRLLCCETCENSVHLSCLSPPLDEVPEGDWHCDMCIKKGIVSAPGKRINNTEELESNLQSKSKDEGGNEDDAEAAFDMLSSFEVGVFI